MPNTYAAGIEMLANEIRKPPSSKLEGFENQLGI
jgi:hypothetical protein